MIEFLQWDSNFFNLKIGKVILQGNESLTLIENNSYDLVYIFSDNAKLDFKLVDKKIVYQINILQREKSSISANVELYTHNEKHYEDLLNLAWQSAEFSRFRLDENFSENQYKLLYKEWLDKSISKDLATHIIVKTHNNTIIGFATLSKKDNLLADIGLVAVDKSYRGLGIAKELINDAIMIAKEEGYEFLQVVTQLDNLPANNLYKKSGFLQNSLTYIYHYWNRDTI